MANASSKKGAKLYRNEPVYECLFSMYTPQYSPIENLFEILKSKYIMILTTKIYRLEKGEGINIIVNEMRTIDTDRFSLFGDALSVKFVQA